MKAMSKKVIKGGDLSHETSLAERVQERAPAERAVQLASEFGGVVQRKTLDAQRHAEEIIADAETEAARIRADAAAVLQEVESVRLLAHTDGHREGREAGLASVTDMLLHYETLREKFFTTAEPEILALVMQITEKIIGRVAESKGELIRAVVRQAIEAAIGDRLLVRVNPADLAHLTAAESELRDLIDRTRRLHFKDDESISPGGCIIESEVGTIDARLETQLKAIRKALELK